MNTSATDDPGRRLPALPLQVRHAEVGSRRPAAAKGGGAVAPAVKRGTLPDLGKQFRALEVGFRRLERAEGDPEDAPALYEISISSETPVERWWGKEVLSHEKNAIDPRYLDIGLAALVDHRGEQVGVVVKWWVAEKSRKLMGHAQFSRSARGREVEQDVVDEIRRHTSVGYLIVKAKLISQGKAIEDDEWLVTRWVPVEVSLVSIPADVSVGVGRSEERGERYPVEIEGGPAAEEERMLCNKCNTEHTGACPTGARENGGPAVEVVGRGAGGSSGAPPFDRKAYQQEQAEMIRVCENNGIPHAKVAEWVEKGLDRAQIFEAILKERMVEKLAQPAAERAVALSDKDARRYSYARAIARQFDGELDGLEGEVHQEIARKTPMGYKPKGGVFVPLRLAQPGEKRALASNASGAGAEVVFDQPGELIELLRSTSVLTRMGARVLADLTGPVPFPKQTSPAVAQWVGENTGSDIPETQIGLGVTNLAPKTLMAATSYARQLLVQAGVDTEAMVREDLAAVHGLAWDRAGIHGKGASGEPAGIYTIIGVQAKGMAGVPDYPKVVDMTAMAADKNALLGSLGWVTTPKMAGLLKTKPLLSGAAAGFIWEGPIGEGSMAGYKAIASNQISGTMTGSTETGGGEQGMIFANWADLIIGMWAAMELIVDPFTKKKQALIEVASFQMTDIMVRHEESFVKSTGATLS